MKATKSKVGIFARAVYSEAIKQGCVVASMKNNWKRMFAFEQ